MAAPTREIVNLQLGHYANFVGTHWWNLQEASFVYDSQASNYTREINHDVLFREGQNLMGDVTYTPRLVALDLKGSLNTLKEDGVLYDLPEEGDVLWPGDVTLHKRDDSDKNDFLADLERRDAALRGEEPQPAKSKEDVDLKDIGDGKSKKKSPPPDVANPTFGKKVYNLDEKVEVWSDFLRLHLHPRTIHIVNQYQHNSDIDAFEVFVQGLQVYHEELHKLDDKLHFFLEEADQLQGIHMLVDTNNGFGGIGAAMLETLADDYSSKSLFVLGVSPPHFPKSTITQDSYRIVSSALAYSRLTQHSSAFLPLSVAPSLWRKPGSPRSYPYLNYRSDLHYHSSAVLGAAMEHFTLPYRLSTSAAATLTQLTDTLTPCSRKILGAQLGLPTPMTADSYFADSLMKLGDTLPWQPVTPYLQGTRAAAAQSIVVRGMHPRRIKSAALAGQWGGVSSVEDAVDIYSRLRWPGTSSAIHSVPGPCKVTDPFPHIFDPCVSSAGTLTNNTHRPSHQAVESVGGMSVLQSSPDAAVLLRDLHKHAAKLSMRKLHKFTEYGLEEDDYTECLEGLLTMAGCYDD